jgi:hypothetical protein
VTESEWRHAGKGRLVFPLRDVCSDIVIELVDRRKFGLEDQVVGHAIVPVRPFVGLTTIGDAARSVAVAGAAGAADVARRLLLPRGSGQPRAVVGRTTTKRRLRLELWPQVADATLTEQRGVKHQAGIHGLNKSGLPRSKRSLGFLDVNITVHLGGGGGDGGGEGGEGELGGGGGGGVTSAAASVVAGGLPFALAGHPPWPVVAPVDRPQLESTIDVYYLKRAILRVERLVTRVAVVCARAVDVLAFRVPAASVLAWVAVFYLCFGCYQASLPLYLALCTLLFSLLVRLPPPPPPEGVREAGGGGIGNGSEKESGNGREGGVVGSKPGGSGGGGGVSAAGGVGGRGAESVGELLAFPVFQDEIHQDLDTLRSKASKLQALVTTVIRAVNRAASMAERLLNLFMWAEPGATALVFAVALVASVAITGTICVVHVVGCGLGVCPFVGMVAVVVKARPWAAATIAEAERVGARAERTRLKLQRRRQRRVRGLASGKAGEGEAGGEEGGEEGDRGEEEGEKRGEGGKKKGAGDAGDARGVEGAEGGASEEKTEHAGGAEAADKAAEHGGRSVGTSVDSVDSEDGDGHGEGDGDGANEANNGNGSNCGLFATRSGEIGLGAWCSNLLSHVPDDDELVHRAIARRQQQILV